MSMRNKMSNISPADNISDFVLDFFKNTPNGKFLEIGANDGCPNAPFEPCWGLLKKGWHGSYIEPNPFGNAELIKNLLDHKLIDNTSIYNFAIGEKTEIKKFYISRLHPSISSVKKDWVERLGFYDPDINYLKTEINVHTTSLNDFFKYTGYNFNFISIDMEIDEADLDLYISSIDFNHFQNLELLCIEGSDDRYIIPHLNKFNFKKLLIIDTVCFFSKNI